MTLRRAFPLVLVLAALPFQPALAQFGGTPGMPGSPPAPAAPPPACQQLLTIRGEVQKHSMALVNASRQKAHADQACKLFKLFLASETKLIEGLEQHKALCGIPDDAIERHKVSHAKAEKAGKQVCDAVPVLDWKPMPGWRAIPDWGPRPQSPHRLRLADGP